MKYALKLLSMFAIVVFTGTSQGQSKVADKTLEDLEVIFKLTNAEKMLQNVTASMENGMKEGVRASTKGKQLSAAQNAYLDSVGKEIMSFMKEMLAFEKMKPLIIEAYVQTYTADEIARIRALQELPDSKMMVSKQTTLMEKTNQATMKLIGPAVQAMSARMQALQNNMPKE